jgi:radical SAM superfamily enzyme YgiQ (UPF0313 family)
MSSRVVLISSNQCNEPYPVFPLGLSQVDTALRLAGHTTRLYDCNIDTTPIEELVAEFQPDLVGIACRNVDDIQYTSRQTYYDAPARLTKVVRGVRDCPVVLGGSAFSLYPEQMLELSGAQYGVVGEGEHAMVALLAAIETGADDLSHIPGLVYRRDGSIVKNPRQPISPDKIIAADRHAHLVDHYLRRSAMLNIQTQRGCGLRCCYCTYPVIEGNIPRRRDPDDVAEELARLTRQGVRHVFVADSVFNTTNDHAAGVCESILRHGVKIEWSCFLRPHGITAEFMGLLKRAGMTHVEFGADSFCDPVLAEYGKSFTFDDIRQASEAAHAARVHYSHFLICGGPGETTETLRTTFEHSRLLPGAVIFGLAGMRIYPGTTLQQRALQEGRITAQTNLLEPVYYLSPHIREEELLALLAEFKQKAPNWIIGALPPFFTEFADRLRQRGVTGPLWEYLSVIQRTQPPSSS